jgi:hypothetical protein
MCLLGKIAKGAAKVSPFGLLGVGHSLFGGGKKKTVNNYYADPFNPRGSYTDKDGNTIVPREVMQAQKAQLPTGATTPAVSMFAKRG